jgi:hypothetical protein
LERPIDRTETAACAKRTRAAVVRTAALLIGAVLASILAVDLPVPAANRSAEPYVPASERWIALGAEKMSDSGDLITPWLQQRSRDGV